eukprot:sb/3469624/
MDFIGISRYDDHGTYIGGFVVKFDVSFTYWLNGCTSTLNGPNGYTDLPVEPPAEINKTWTFTQTSTVFVISCNGMEVLNYTFLESPYKASCQNWIDKKVGFIKFLKVMNTGTDFYRAKPMVVAQEHCVKISEPLKLRCRRNPRFKTLPFYWPTRYLPTFSCLKVNGGGRVSKGDIPFSTFVVQLHTLGTSRYPSQEHCVKISEPLKLRCRRNPRFKTLPFYWPTR